MLFNYFCLDKNMVCASPMYLDKISRLYISNINIIILIRMSKQGADVRN